MFDQNGQISLQLGTATNVLSEKTFSHRDHPIYLTNPPYDNRKPLIDNFSVLYFLSTFKNNKYTFSQTHKLKNPKRIDNQIFTNFMLISRHQTNLFKIYYQVSGYYFAIQIINLFNTIKYKKIHNVKFKKNERTVYVYSNIIIKNPNPNSPFQIIKNKGMQELSDFYNNQSVDRSIQNPITATIFYTIAPFNCKTIKRQKHKQMNPDDSIESILKNYGGFLFRFHPTEEVDLNQYQFGIFSWFSPYFLDIVKSHQFEQATTIELDATFRALAPYAICVPHLIFRNTGIPLAILISPSEKTSLYSIFFESLKKLDEFYENSEENSLFLKFKNKKYLSDEHKAFQKLAKNYDLDFYYCLVHLIRSIGANSLLGLLFSDILFTFSGFEWSKHFNRYYQTFQLLYNLQENKDDARFEKVSKVLGVDVNGNYVEVKKEYSPYFKRSVYGIPTTTNHVESFHKQLNGIFKATRLSLPLRLAYIIKYIMDRTLRTNSSAHLNVKTHLNKFKDKAYKEISKNPNLKSNYSQKVCLCRQYYYYYYLYCVNIPCVHCILNDYWKDQNYIHQMEEFDIKFDSHDIKYDQLLEFDIKTELTFRKRKKSTEGNNDNNDNNNNNFQIGICLDGKNYSDSMTTIIDNTTYQLSEIIAKNNLNITVIALAVQRELMPVEETYNIDEYLALFQVKLWTKIISDGNKKVNI